MQEAILGTKLAELGMFNDLTIYAKLENENPTGTIKYRTALRMIQDAERSGGLRKGMRIIEHTSGNTGIALAYIGQKLGYPVTIITGRPVTSDSKRLIRTYGAELVEVDGWFKDCDEKVSEIIRGNQELYYWPQQVKNQSSLASNTDLGREIASQFRERGKQADIFLASMGTGSTIAGVAAGLKKVNPDTIVYLVLPEGEYIYAGVDDKEESTVPLPLFDPRIVDKRIRVGESAAIAAARELHLDYGHYVGVSSGAVFAAARHLGLEERASGNAVITFPDKGDRYTDVLGAE